MSIAGGMPPDVRVALLSHVEEMRVAATAKRLKIPELIAGGDAHAAARFSAEAMTIEHWARRLLALIPPATPAGRKST